MLLSEFATTTRTAFDSCVARENYRTILKFAHPSQEEQPSRVARWAEKYQLDSATQQPGPGSESLFNVKSGAATRVEHKETAILDPNSANAAPWAGNIPTDVTGHHPPHVHWP
eukprot:762849-Hanusia_phi.AAC.2